MISGRRALLVAGAATFAWPLLAKSQAKPRSVGLLHVGDDHVPPSYAPLLKGMQDLGYREGVDIQYDFRNALDEKVALEAARDLVRRRADLIVAFDQEASGIAREATGVIPIVVIHATNPVAAGFAKSLARPGGNMTGFAGRALLVPKELELLKEIAPKLQRVLLLFDSRDLASLESLAQARDAARRLSVTLLERDVTDPASLKTVFGKLKHKEADAVVIASYVIRHRYQVIVLQLATDKGMAAVGSRRDVVEKGALFTYAYDFAKVGRAAASRYVDPILKGKNPGELPIEEVTDNELVVNDGVARRHGWTLSQAVVQRAERIIQ